MADVAPDPKVVQDGGNTVALVAGLFASAAIVVLGILLVRRRRGK
jgi:LPXTG-motif cell wall-anchored protein